MEQIKGFCPYCHKEVAFSWVSFSETGGSVWKFLQGYLENKTGIWAVGECPSCEKCVLIHFYRDHYNELKLAEIFPYSLPYPTDERIPEKIRKDLDEAKLCLSVNAYRGCAVMCRRSLQAACIDQGVNKDETLEKQIDELKAIGVINRQIQEWSHSVRWIGNDAAHPESPEVTKDDAKAILNLAEQIMNILYVMPAIAKEKNKIHGKKK